MHLEPTPELFEDTHQLPVGSAQGEAQMHVQGLVTLVVSLNFPFVGVPEFSCP